MVVWEGVKARLDVLAALAFQGASDGVLRDLVAGDDPHMSDRMQAIWWRFCYPPTFFDRPEGADAWCRANLFRPVAEMVEGRVMEAGALPFFETRIRDPYARDREWARRHTADELARIRALAEEEV